MKLCLEIVANLPYGGEQAANKVTQMSLSNNAAKHCSDMNGENMKQQLMAKLLEALCFALQFDQTTDINNSTHCV